MIAANIYSSGATSFAKSIVRTIVNNRHLLVDFFSRRTSIFCSRDKKWTFCGRKSRLKSASYCPQVRKRLYRTFPAHFFVPLNNFSYKTHHHSGKNGFIRKFSTKTTFSIFVSDKTGFFWHCGEAKKRLFRVFGECAGRARVRRREIAEFELRT